MRNQVHLLASRRFFPLFLTQFLGAFNDNLFKNALVIMIMYASLEAWGLSSGALVAAAGGIFILPFFLFSATAGQLADKYEKSAIIRLVKLWEILLMLLAALGFMWMDTGLLLAVLFLMGTQSTFFGPIKYGILPDHLEREELIAGNALVEAATFVAILLGTIAGGLLIAAEGGRATVAVAVVAVALAGFGASLFIPKAPAPAPNLAIGWNILAESWRIIGFSRATRPVFLSILGVSWFWLIGAIFLSIMPVYAKQTLGGGQGVVTLFLAMFSVGTGLGSLLCNKLLKGEIDTRFVPLGAFGMTLFGLDLCLASWDAAPAGQTLMDVAGLLAQARGWRISFDLFMIAFCGGLFIVPLYAVMQTRCQPAQRARIIAANNIMNALFMVASAGAAAAMLGAGFTPVGVFMAVSILNGGAYFIIRSLATESGDRPVLRLLFTMALMALYRVRTRGVENLSAAGGGTMIVANHQSFLDGVLLAVFLPGRFSFVVNRFMAGHWWARIFLGLVDTHTLDAQNPMAIKKLVNILRQGGRLVIFPEGRITVTGALMKIHDGPALIADKAGASILPVRIDGAQATHFSRMTDKIKPRIFPKINITALPPRKLEIDPGLTGALRRRAAAESLAAIMTDMMFQGADIHRSIPQAVRGAMDVFGQKRKAVEDDGPTFLTYAGLLGRAARFANMLPSRPGQQRFIGALMPNSADAVAAILGAQMAGYTPAIMNPDWNQERIQAAIKAAGLASVMTSRSSCQIPSLLASAGVAPILMEDTGASDSSSSRTEPSPASSAAALFASDGAGQPRWIEYSHQGLLANTYQLAAVLDLGPADTIFCAPSLA
ncbi:MAG: MFS transporter, partial [Nitrospinota bacterium]|nr:MFS transporter [Nitrospinota bacterium]